MDNNRMANRRPSTTSSIASSLLGRREALATSGVYRKVVSAKDDPTANGVTRPPSLRPKFPTSRARSGVRHHLHSRRLSRACTQMLLMPLNRLTHLSRVIIPMQLMRRNTLTCRTSRNSSNAVVVVVVAGGVDMVGITRLHRTRIHLRSQIFLVIRRFRLPLSRPSSR